MKDLYIIGAGGMGRELFNIIQSIHAIRGQRWNVKGFLDDTPDPLHGKRCDLPVLGRIVDYEPKPNEVLALGIADPAGKKKVVSLLKNRGAIFENIIHPYANLGRYNSLGEGLVIYPGFGVTVNTDIGNFCTFLSCGIGHDVTIGDFCTISSCCNIMGGVTIGEGTFIGGNVAIAPHVNIGKDAYLCLGSMVIKDVMSGAKVMGNPAREVG